MKYRNFLSDVIEETKKAIKANSNAGFHGHEFACKVMDSVYADACENIQTEEEAIEIFNRIGLTKLFRFYKRAGSEYTSIYQVCDNGSNDDEVDILADPVKFVTEMVGMVACELVYFAEGYGNDHRTAEEEEILRKFDSDEGGEISQDEINVIVGRVHPALVRHNCNLAKELM